MVDSINNGAAVSSLLRAQSTAISNLKVGNQATQTLIDQLQKTATAPAKSTAVTQVTKSAGASAGNLPRGSLVDIIT